MAESTAELTVLMAESDQRRSETMAFYTRYEKQTQILTVYLTTLSILYVLVVSLRGTTKTFSVPGIGMVPIAPEILAHPELTSVVGLTGGALIAFFFISNLLETVHVMQLLQARAGAVECAINRMLGKDYLTWDSRLIPEFYETRGRSGIFFEPSWLVGLWAALLFVSIIGVLSFFSRMLLSSHWLYWAFPFWTLSAYHIAEWVWLVRVRGFTMKKVAQEHVDILSPGTDVDNH